MNIKFRTGGAAFDDDGLYFESARILREIAKDVENGAECGLILDINGYVIGEWSL